MGPRGLLGLGTDREKGTESTHGCRTKGNWIRLCYARWTDTRRFGIQLSRAGHLKASAPVPDAVLPPFGRSSSNRRQKRMRVVNPPGNDVGPVPVSPDSPSLRPGKSFCSQTASSGQKNYRLRIRRGRCPGTDQRRSEKENTDGKE